MLSKISRFVAIAALTTLTCIITNPSEAQPIQSNETPSVDVIEPSTPLNVNELVNRAFSEYGGDFFESATIEGSLNTIFGWRSSPQGSFPENNVTRDGLLLSIIMSDYFKRLQEENPTIRTRDIANPFDTSLGDNPDYTGYAR